MVPKAAWWLGTEDCMLVSYPEMRYTDLYCLILPAPEVSVK